VVGTEVVAAGEGVLVPQPVIMNAVISRIATGTSNFFTFSSFYGFVGG
jgi:hypothetical protein